LEETDMKKTLEERKAEAMELRRRGYNCAQSTIMVFDDVTGLDSDMLARLTSGLGTGLGCGEVCGVVNAMALAQGALRSADPSAKAFAGKCSRELTARFAADNDGRVRCADLKSQPGVRPCNDLVAQGVEILHDYFSQLPENA
jgi:hypothetical protein